MISVLIASKGRPFLKQTLKSISEASIPTGETVEIIIADDSPDAAVSRVLVELKLAMTVTVLPVGAGNVAMARNACLEAAKGDWLIFVDDDERVEPDWLQGHLSAAQDFDADAVFGPVFPRYPEATPQWLLRANPLFQDWNWDEDGRETPRGRTGNTLVRHSALGALRFDEEFGRSGGEDDDFFLRFAAQGHRMVVTNRARAHEDVPAERANAKYALNRAQRTGQLYARLRLRNKGVAAVLAFATGAMARMLVFASSALVLRPFDRPKAFRLYMRAWNNAGKLLQASGASAMPVWS